MQGPEVNKLLDVAKTATGSDYETAKRAGIPRTLLSDWRHGRRPMPPADVAVIADIAGLDAVAWCARAVAEPHHDTPKGALIESALKKALAVTGVAIAIDGNALATELIRCAKCKVLKLRSVVHARLTREASRSGFRGANRTRRSVVPG